MRAGARPVDQARRRHRAGGGRHRRTAQPGRRQGAGPAGRRAAHLHRLSARRRARATARLLHDQGVGAGDRVLAALPNGLEFFDLWFAAGIVGAALVPVNPLSTPDELAWVLADASCRLCVGDATTVTSLRRARDLAAATDTPLLAAAGLAAGGA